MNNCYNNYIGLKGLCVQTDSDSGLYINSAAGIDSEALALLSGKDDFQTLVDVYQRIKDRAFLRLQTEARNRMFSIYKFDLQDVITFGRFKEPFTPAPASVLRRGVKLRYIGSRFGEVYVKSLRVNSLIAVVGAQFTITDAGTGQILDTITADLIVGTNIIPVNKVYDAQPNTTWLYISYLDPAIQLYETQTGYGYAGGWYDIALNGNCNCEACDYLVANGGTFDTTLPVLTDANIVLTNITGGLIVDYQVRCSLTKFLCEQQTNLTDVWFKLLQYEFWEEVRNSQRINHQTTEKKAYIAEKMGKIKKEYQDILDTFFYSFIPSDDCCFICNEPVRQPFTLP